MIESSESKYEKLVFVVEENDGSSTCESVWVRAVGDSLYCVDNIPFFVDDVSIGDVISAEVVDNVNYFKEIVERSGSSIVRVMVNDELYVEEAINKLQEFGCHTERMLPKVFALEVPAELSFENIIDYLWQGEQSKRWIYETSCLRHEY
ncbi:MAG: DUF4265 domain-containing protein [Anaerolineae bacterium]|nr:DUF4265 domain-containing protein [Gloeobacterales cyanobacterium ES-bin-313]